MFSFFVFILAGVALIAMTVAKRFEMRDSESRKILILRLISKGDERVRNLYHEGLRFYSDGKLKAVFFMKKQLPARAKIYATKNLSWIRARFEARFGDMRNSRLIKREEGGVSEFFKNISEIEKKTGELHEEIYAEGETLTQDVLAVPEEAVKPEPQPEPAPARSRKAPAKASKPRAPRKKMTKPKEPRKPANRVKKVPVIEVEEY